MRGTVKTKQFFWGFGAKCLCTPQAFELQLLFSLLHLGRKLYHPHLRYLCCPQMILLVQIILGQQSSPYIYFFVLLLVYYIVQTVKCNIILYNFIEEKYL